MFPQIFLVTLLLSLKGFNGEKATSFVSVSKAKEGGYSYEVIHDYPTKDSSASVHFYGDVEDYIGDKAPDVSYDYEINHIGPPGVRDAAFTQPVEPSVGPPNKQSYQISGVRQAKKPQTSFENHISGNGLNAIKSFGVLRHAATSPDNSQPNSQAYSSTFVKIKHKMRSHSVGGAHLKSHGSTSYTYDAGSNNVDTLPPSPYRTKGTASLNDFKGNPLDSGGGNIQASASGPGFAFSNPGHSSYAAVDYGPIVYHHHHYHGETIDEGPVNYQHGLDIGNGITENAKSPGKNRGYGHSSHTRHAGQVGSISIAASLGHTCSSNDVTPLPFEHPKRPDAFFNFAQYHNHNRGFSQPHEANGYPQESHRPSSNNNFHGGAKGLPIGEKKGKWKPVVITTSQAKGKLHTFRISKDFKPGKLMTGFKPSFGPPGHHEQHSGHLKQAVSYDPFSNFHDAPYFDYDSLIASVDSHELTSPNDEDASHSFDEFPDYGSSEKKSLKDYHNSLSYPLNYRQGKTSTSFQPLSANPIVVPPIRTTTTHSATTISSPIPGITVNSFISPVSTRGVHYVPSLPALNSESDQATSYANPNNHSLRRSIKRKKNQAPQ